MGRNGYGLAVEKKGSKTYPRDTAMRIRTAFIDQAPLTISICTRGLASSRRAVTRLVAALDLGT